MGIGDGHDECVAVDWYPMTYHSTVCSECGMGEWRDLEPGDTIRCPWCDKRVEVTWLTDFEFKDE
jgi:DNA-directed RNA polymerase subunit RPC12/RpoP